MDVDRFTLKKLNEGEVKGIVSGYNQNKIFSSRGH
jgi:hypothetical protein